MLVLPGVVASSAPSSGGATPPPGFAFVVSNGSYVVHPDGSYVIVRIS